MADHTWQIILGGLSNPALNGLTGWEIINLELDDPALWVTLTPGEQGVIRHAAQVASDERARDVMREFGDG